MSGRGADRLRIFDKLEQSIERLVEGPVGRVFAAKVQPAEIGRRLERAMTVNQAIALDGILAPNDFVIRIHPEDLAVFGEYADGLSTEYEDWLVAIAEDRGYRFVGEVSVRFLADPGAPRRSPRVTAALVEQGPAPELSPDAGFASAGPTRYALAIADATYGTRRVPLSAGSNVVGRAPSCDIVIEHASVSRVHARIHVDGGRIDLVDLGSTNGTRVDGQPVVSSHLEAGSIVTFGAIDAELAVDRPAGGRR